MLLPLHNVLLFIQYASYSSMLVNCIYDVCSLLIVMFEGFVRQKETWKGMETVNKILNGGGGLSIELIKDATLFFPRAKLLSAYGGCLSYIVSPKYSVLQVLF